MSNVHFDRHLIHTCVIQRGSESFASYTGEPTLTYSSLGSFACRFVERSERIADEGAGFPMAEEPWVYLKNTATIQEEDRVANITLNSSGSLVEVGPLTVEQLLKRNSTAPFHIAVKLRRIE